MGEHFRLRVCFRKSGRLRYLSHLETMRACERATRRAGLPYAVTQGFTPRMRIAFGPALPVGTAGEREYFDVLLTRYVPASEALRALVGASVEELAAVACGYADVREPSLAAALTIAEYELIVKGGTPPEEFERSLSDTIATGSLLVMHKGKEKVFDLAEALPKRPEVTVRDGWPVVRIWVHMSDRGSLRPEALVRAADPSAVVSVTRLDLFIEEGGEWRRPLERGTPWQTSPARC